MLKTNRNDEEYDVCVVCGARTRYKRSEPLESRVDYIPGAGQLCRRCAAENISDEQMARRNDFVYDLPYFQKISGKE